MLKISLVVLLSVASFTAQSADVYVAFDAQGAAHFSDKALDDSYRLLFQDLQTGALAQALPTQPLAASAMPRVTVSSHAVPAGDIRLALEGAARRHGLDYALLHAVAHAESGFNPLAVSPKGAIGVMQLMPDTARRYGVKAEDAAELRAKLHQSAINTDAGGRFLSDLMRQFNGQIELVLAAYNAGEGAVKRQPHSRLPRDAPVRVQGAENTGTPQVRCGAGSAAGAGPGIPERRVAGRIFSGPRSSPASSRPGAKTEHPVVPWRHG